MHAETTKRTARRSRRAWPVLLSLMGWMTAAASLGESALDVDAPITASWRGVDLRSWASRLSARAGVPIVVDRRLDPNTSISLECRAEPLHVVVARAAEQAHGESVVLARWLHIAPPGITAALLAGEHERTTRLDSLPMAQRRKVATRQAWTWPEAATPSELVTDLAAQAGVPLEAIDSLPHDHLPATTLPPLSLAERFDLVLAHYDRRIDWQPGPADRPQARIVPLAPASTTERPTSRAGRRTTPRPPAPREPAPAPRAATRPAKPRDTFSLKVAAPLGQLLDVLAGRLGLTLALDRESLRSRGVTDSEIVKASIENASREELLDAILDPLGLDWEIAGKTLRVFAAPR